MLIGILVILVKKYAFEKTKKGLKTMDNANNQLNNLSMISMQGQEFTGQF